VALLSTMLVDETQTMAALRLIHVFRHIAQQPLAKGLQHRNAEFA
jgi:hypothetical protein